MLHHTVTFYTKNVTPYRNIYKECITVYLNMIIKELLDIVADLNFWYKDQDTGLKRSELVDVLKLVDMKDTALIILGVRRAGKTTLSKQILKEKMKKIKKEQTLYVNFEDKKLEPFLNSEILDNIYETYRYHMNKDKFAYIVLDEVHNIEGWEKWVRMMLEKKENVKIIITGSGSKILTPKLASVLTGRKITYHLFPLSFSDFLKFKRKNKKYIPRKDLEFLLREYIEFGAFPLVVLTESSEQKKYFLQEVYDDIITKDIMFRYRLREENILRKTAYFLLSSFAKYVSIRKIRNSLKSLMGLNVSPSTLSYYLEYFERSFLFIFLPIFSYNVKDQMQYPKKVYCVDTGLINAVIPKFSENIGRLCENVVVVELKRRGKEIYYWRDKQQNEVDFVVKDGMNVSQLIQVCYNLTEKNKMREIKPLLKACEELKCNNLLMITKDKESVEKINGKTIKFIPLWKWLLNK